MILFPYLHMAMIIKILALYLVSANPETWHRIHNIVCEIAFLDLRLLDLELFYDEGAKILVQVS